MIRPVMFSIERITMDNWMHCGRQSDSVRLMIGRLNIYDQTFFCMHSIGCLDDGMSNGRIEKVCVTNFLKLIIDF